MNPAGAICGAIVYANGGGYVVNPTRLHALGNQPDATLHEDCAEVGYKFDFDIDVNQYGTFVVPANCGYNLQISIVAGNDKHQKFFLTPGCQITGKTGGTTTSNKWHFDIAWIKGKKPPNAPTKPVDSDGNNCGKLNNM